MTSLSKFYKDLSTFFTHQKPKNDQAYTNSALPNNFKFLVLKRGNIKAKFFWTSNFKKTQYHVVKFWRKLVMFLVH